MIMAGISVGHRRAVVMSADFYMRGVIMACQTAGHCRRTDHCDYRKDREKAGK